MVECLTNDKEIDFDYKTRLDFKSVQEAWNFLASGDVSHVDDLGVLEAFYLNGFTAPDVIGPIARSPIKEYKDNRQTAYPREWFYSARVIRLNYSEERNNPELVKLVRHGVNTNFLKPTEKPKKYVLWAGNTLRYAKNFDLMKEIMAVTKLPSSYEWKVLHNYKVKDYWKILDKTAILVNTSRYESFCCALFEARAKGVATIQRKLLNGRGVHEKAPVQVEYTPEAYKEKILDLLENKKYIEVGRECREYCERTASLKVMRDDLVEVYKEAYENK